MNLKASLLIIRRFLVSPLAGTTRRFRGAILAVSLSLVPLIVVMEISDGMIQGITARYLELGTYHLQALSFDEPSAKDFQDLLVRLEREPGVVLVVPERQGLGLAYSKDGRAGATIRAVPPDLWKRDKGLRSYLSIHQGDFDLSTPDSAVLGTELAGKLGVGVGSEVKVLTTRSLGNEGIIPRVTTFKVKGIVSTGYQELDKLWLYIPLERGDRILSKDTSRKILGVKVADPFGDVTSLVDRLYRGLPPGFRVYSWYELERAQYMSFTTTRYLLLFIMALILCVASVNISSTLVMLQIEKREEIAILKSLGLGPADITRIFLGLGFIVGAVGTFLGIFTGLAIAVSINEIVAFIEAALNFFAGLGRYFFSFAAEPGAGEPIRLFNPQFYLEYIPIRIDFLEIGLTACFSLLITLLASYFPSHGAGRTRPLEVLRKH